MSCTCHTMTRGVCHECTEKEFQKAQQSHFNDRLRRIELKLDTIINHLGAKT